MLRNPNSNPPKGKNANSPPKPMIPKIPKAQDGHAGAKTAMMIPDAPTGTPEEICLRKRKTLNAATIPASKDIMIKEINAPPEKLVNIPPINPSSNLIEKSANNIR